MIKEVKPGVGQRSGGITITVSGYLPDVGLKVDIENINGQIQQVQFDRV